MNHHTQPLVNNKKFGFKNFSNQYLVAQGLKDLAE